MSTGYRARALLSVAAAAALSTCGGSGSSGTRSPQMRANIAGVDWSGFVTTQWDEPGNGRGVVIEGNLTSGGKHATIDLRFSGVPQPGNLQFGDAVTATYTGPGGVVIPCQGDGAQFGVINLFEASSTRITGTFSFTTRGFDCPFPIEVTDGQLDFQPTEWDPYGNASTGGQSDGGANDGASDATVSVVSCTDTQTYGNPPAAHKYCTETSGVSGADIDSLRMSCVSSDGGVAGVTDQKQFDLAPCSHDQAIGGCMVPGGNTTNWYYAGDTAIGPGSCEVMGADFVSP
jgi:hypothetical protein